MPNEEILQLILTELKEIKTDVSGLKQDVLGLKEGQARLEQEMVGVNKRLDSMEVEMHDIKEKVTFTADVVDQSLKMQDNLEVRVVELEKAI